MVAAGKKATSLSTSPSDWTTLLCTRKGEAEQLEALRADLGDWKDVLWGTGSNGPGFDFHIGYETAHNLGA